MIADINFFGVFINGALMTGALALLLLWPVRVLLVATRLYRFVWHPALVDVALFIVSWGLVARCMSSFAAWFAVLLG